MGRQIYITKLNLDLCVTIDYLPIAFHHSTSLLITGSSIVEVRLVGNRVPNVGRVEVRYYGVWKSICDTNWDLQDANVICRMLGCSQGAAAAIRGYQGSGDVWLSIVNCNGNEKSLEKCRNLNWGQGSCANHKRAGVVCNSGQ
jgi:hypothetical protein